MAKSRHNDGKMKKIASGGSVRVVSGNKNVLSEAQDEKTRTNLPIAGGLSGSHKALGRKRGGGCK
jgi:hypothetical protein